MLLGAIYKKGGAFKYPKVFQCDNGPKFKGKTEELKYNLDNRIATTKYRHVHTAFVEAFNKELEKLLFKQIDPKELQSTKNVSTIWVKNLGPAVKTLSNTISSMIVKKPKAAIKLDTAPLDKTFPEETILPEEGL